MLTSIQICTRNMRVFLESALRSSFCQLGREYEVLCIDDGSDDGTWEFLEGLKNYPSLRVFRNETRQGLTHCRNFLLTQSRGELISILDADDLILPHKVSHHAAVFKKNPNVGLVYGRGWAVGPKRLPRLDCFLPVFEYKPSWDLTMDYQIIHSATTWKKKALEAVGGYDPKWTLLEAVDMYLKVGEMADTYFDPTIVALKRNQPDGELRKQVQRNGLSLSRSLLKNTIYRRLNRSYLPESHA